MIRLPEYVFDLHFCQDEIQVDLDQDQPIGHLLPALLLSGMCPVENHRFDCNQLPDADAATATSNTYHILC